MVASPHALATAAGVDVLRRGGNAVDAAIAANAVLTVVYPASCGIGGDALWLVFEPRAGATIAYNGSGGAPAGLRAQTLRDQGLRAMPARGPLTVTVPGAVRSWEQVASAHGTRDLDELLGAAERYARDGFVVTDVVAAQVSVAAELLQADAEARSLFFPAGPVRAGDVVRNPMLADSLHAIRMRGAAGFYEGPTAQAICASLARRGNPMSLEDLASHATERTTPLSLPWRGTTVLAHPPNSQGAVAPMVLRMLERDGGSSDPRWTHLAIEAIKEAFELRDRRFADPRAMVPADDPLDSERLAAMRAAIDPRRARVRASAPARGGTVAIVAADADGRAVSLIESLYMGFGSGVVAHGTGIFLHNRGSYFSLEPGHPNELDGGKRPLHTLSPAMLLRDGVPELAYGTMGGDGQPQTQVQLLHNLYERGFPLQAAIDAPRFVYGRDSESAFSDSVRVESRMPVQLIAELRERGHAVKVLGPYDHALGHCHAIAFDRERGSIAGASDPRADSLALGL